MKKPGVKIMIVDDEKEICEILARLMEGEGCSAHMVNYGINALEMIRSGPPDVLFTDLKMPGMDGITLMKRAKELDPDLPVVLVTGYADIPGAVNAIKEGAHDYIPKPFKNGEVIRVLHRALNERDLKRKVKHLSRQLLGKLCLSKMMGPSDAVARLISDVQTVSKSDFTVVIQGETGSGKELVAREIHNISHRSGQPFLAIDCGAIPENLLESELFGHEKGSFTGALSQTKGKFEAAKGGTLFLDEISNLPLDSQSKLLRVLQEKNAFRVGGTRPFSVDVRLLVASNRDLESTVASGLFRGDLYYRLNEFTIKIPPLRERPDDILYLANLFLKNTNGELQKNVKGFSESALDIILTYAWPGNVRQLRSTIRRAVLIADDMITDKHLDMRKAPFPGPASPLEMKDLPWKGRSFRDIMRQHAADVERVILINALRHTGGNKAKASRLLHIDYKTIHTKVKKLGISTEGESHERKEK
jgi:DNA-binding NtrC family response regulator